MFGKVLLTFSTLLQAGYVIGSTIVASDDAGAVCSLVSIDDLWRLC